MEKEQKKSDLTEEEKECKHINQERLEMPFGMITICEDCGITL